jgi:adenosylcobinamide-GDP ribazoletransferase
VAPVEVGRSQLWYPLVGLGLGGILYAADLLLQLTDLPPLVVAALLLFLWVAMTGALHLDGLADTADAWVGGYGDPERSLAIMKDPAAGPMGVTVLVLLLLLKFSLLTAWPQGLPVAIVLVPALGRGAVPLLFRALPYLRGEGLGRALADHLPLATFLLIWTPMLGLAGYIIGITVLWLVLGWLSALAILGLLYRRRFGGLTGDMAGAAIEIIETVLLITLMLLQ